MTVVRERRLIVGVSARPFDTVAQLARRLRMAFHTIGVEWREWPPLEDEPTVAAGAGAIRARTPRSLNMGMPTQTPTRTPSTR